MGTITDNPKRMGDILDGNSSHASFKFRRVSRVPPTLLTRVARRYVRTFYRVARVLGPFRISSDSVRDTSLSDLPL